MSNSKEASAHLHTISFLSPDNKAVTHVLRHMQALDSPKDVWCAPSCSLKRAFLLVLNLEEVHLTV